MTFDVATLESLNGGIATAGLLLACAGVLLLIDTLHTRILSPYVQKWGLILAFFVSLISVLMTLVYSELFGITPCGFCWIERMALYPQLILLGVGFYYRDAFMPRYGIALSVFGFFVSLYHHYIQMGGTEFIACPTAGADCAKRFLFEYGFVTFPLLSAILFGFLCVLYFSLLTTSTHTKTT